MDKCELCGVELHSITLHRMNDHLFCRECADIITPYTTRAVEDIIFEVLSCKERWGMQFVTESLLPSLPSNAIPSQS